MRTQLLCTFVKRPTLNSTIEEIMSAYEIVFDKIYVFQNDDDAEDLFCTYNVDAESSIDYNAVDSTISLHRKKHTNTLYTINALNEVIKNLNNGVLNTNYNIPWENFRNTLLVINKEGLNRISTRIFKIINIE